MSYKRSSLHLNFFFYVIPFYSSSPAWLPPSPLAPAPRASPVHPLCEWRHHLQLPYGVQLLHPGGDQQEREELHRRGPLLLQGAGRHADIPPLHGCPHLLHAER